MYGDVTRRLFTARKDERRGAGRRGIPHGHVEEVVRQGREEHGDRARGDGRESVGAGFQADAGDLGGVERARERAERVEAGCAEQVDEARHTAIVLEAHRAAKVCASGPLVGACGLVL